MRGNEKGKGGGNPTRLPKLVMTLPASPVSHRPKWGIKGIPNRSELNSGGIQKHYHRDHKRGENDTTENRPIPEGGDQLIMAVRAMTGLETCFRGRKHFESSLRRIRAIPQISLPIAVGE